MSLAVAHEGRLVTFDRALTLAREYQPTAVTLDDPQTGHYFDDTKRYVDALPISEAQRHAIFEGNARRVFPRLDAQLKARGL